MSDHDYDPEDHSDDVDKAPEIAVLGAAMSGTGRESDLADLLASLTADDFFFPVHAAIWSAIGSLHDQGQTPTATAVGIVLDARSERYDRIALVDMASSAPLLVSAGWYAEAVRVAAGKRRFASAALKLHQLAKSPNTDLEMLREEARQTVDEACSGHAISEAKTMAQIIPEVLHVAEHGRAKVLPTGWADVDRIIGGFAPGRVVVIGARPAVGKSLMGTNLALQFAGTHEHAVLIASLEMDALEVGQRLLANHSRVELTGLAEGTTTDAEWGTISRTHQALEDMPITVVDSATQTVSSIRRAARDVQRRREDLALIVVDYLQLITTTQRKGANRVEALAEVSRGLKNLARESGACVVAMAQVNRESTRSQDGRPRMHDLRESGSIEADADVVILLHRTDEDRETGEMEAIIDKNRHGIDGVTVKLAVHGHMARVADAFWSPTRGIA